MASPTVVLLGTLDTKGREYGYVRDHLIAQGSRVILVDAGVLSEPLIAPDIDRHELTPRSSTPCESISTPGLMLVISRPIPTTPPSPERWRTSFMLI